MPRLALPGLTRITTTLAAVTAELAVPRYCFNWLMLVELKPAADEKELIVVQPAAVGA